MTNKNIVIRKVRPEDLEAVTQVEAACFPKAEAASKEAFAQRIAIFPDQFFVAVAEEQVVGFINGAVTDQKTITDQMFEEANLHQATGVYQAIYGLDVLAAYRKQGMAEKLMRHLIEAARQQGRQGVILTCKEPLIPYYAKFGFENTGLSQSKHGGSVWYDMILNFSSEEMRIRYARPTDLDAISDIEWQAFGEGVATKKAVFKEKLITQAGHILVAEENNEIIGFIEGLSSDEPFVTDEMFAKATLHHETGAWEKILSLVVSNRIQGKGIGKKLLKTVIQQSQERQQVGVALTCKEHLLEYYQGFGFTNEGLSDSKLGGVEWYDMCLKF